MQKATKNYWWLSSGRSRIIRDDLPDSSGRDRSLRSHLPKTRFNINAKSHQELLVAFVGAVPYHTGRPSRLVGTRSIFTKPSTKNKIHHKCKKPPGTTGGFRRGGPVSY